MRSMIVAAWFVAAALSGCDSDTGSGSPPSTAIPGLSEPVTVQYDAQDIPHIQCAAAADCIAVQGYIQARDRWFAMDFLRHAARAKLAELLGVARLVQDVQLRTLFITRDGKRLEDELEHALDPPTRLLLDAFVAGVNAYLAELREGKGELPGEYAQLPFAIAPADLEDWTIQDTLAVTRLTQFQISENLTAESSHGQFAAVYGQGALQDLGKIDAWIRAAAPPSERAHTLSATGTHAAAAARRRGPGPTFDMSRWRNVLDAVAAHAATLREGLLSADASVGSNNWVVAAAKSASHVAMIANDPHLLLQYPPLFHLSAMTSSSASDHLEVTGGSFPGIPGALVGRGAHVGWGVTVVGYDATDLYLEQFLPQDACPGGAAGPPCVELKDHPVSTIVVPQSYRVRVGPGAAGLVDASTLQDPPPPFVVVVPHHGPIIQAPDDAGRAVSVRWTGQEGNTQDMKAIFGLDRAADVDAAAAALEDLAVGAQNFVVADDQGHIAYSAHALVPIRRFADIRVVGADAMPPWFPLPGDGSAEWGDGTSDCAAAGPEPVPASCWVPDDQLPHGKDPLKGYFVTANSDPTGVSDDNNPLGHPPYLSFDWDDSAGFRATRIEQMIEAALAQHGSITLDDMAQIQSDHVSRPGMAFAPIIAALPTEGAPAELIAAQAVIAQWAVLGFDCPSGLLGNDPNTSPSTPDTKVLQSSAGCLLFHAFVRTLVTAVFTDDLAVAGQAVNPFVAVKAALFLLGLPDGAPGTSFCNDVDSAGELVMQHACGEQAANALVTAYRDVAAQLGPDPIGWVWGRVHTINPASELPLASTDYRPGPYARPGGAYTVDVGCQSLSGTGLAFPYTFGGAVRVISVMDPGAPIVRMQLPGPERDRPASSPGPDLLGLWVNNTYFDYPVGDQIHSAAVSTQVFEAPRNEPGPR